MSRVYVTGVGVISSLGFGRESFSQAMTEGKCGFAPIESFDTGPFNRSIGGEVRGFTARDFLTAAEARRTGRCSAFAVAASRMAVEDAGLRPEHLAGERTSVIMGTTMGEGDVMSELERVWIHQGLQAVETAKIPRYGTTLLPIHVARALGARGMVQTFPTACAAGNYSLAFGADQIRAGRADVVIAGASEIIHRLQFAGFVRLGAMAPEKCQPFDKNRKGIILGEGAGVLVLESEQHAVRRNARPLAEVGGSGVVCDAHHITRPHPDGVGNCQAILDAARESGIALEDVDFVNAHGTGTHQNDKIEAQVIRKVFGERPIPVTSLKSQIGHCMGAASAMEAVACVVTIETGVYSPTLGYETPDPECDVNLVANRAVEGKADIVINNSLGFGGHDAIVTFARPGRLPDISAAPLQ